MRIIQTNEYYNDDRNHMILLFVFEYLSIFHMHIEQE